MDAGPRRVGAAAGLGGLRRPGLVRRDLPHAVGGHGRRPRAACRSMGRPSTRPARASRRRPPARAVGNT
eukprot:10539638-Alexandrium_andersonii.AAC.1